MKGSRGEVNELLVHSHNCKIRLLDDVEISCDFKKETKGQFILDFVCKELDLLEKDYFGLRFVDCNKQRHWLDLCKDVSKQLKECKQPHMFFFRVKFYPTDPNRLAEEITRYQMYLQLKRDILHGRLLCPFTSITELAGHAVQAEIGDYDSEYHNDTYIADMKLLPRQNDKLEEKISDVHKSLSGLTPSQAETSFLTIARNQDLYGVDPHPCTDDEELQLYLGLTPQGIQIIREAKRVSGFTWQNINKVSYDNKSFYLQTIEKKKKRNFSFRLSDSPACKHLWKCVVEHMAFYGDEPIKKEGPKWSALSPQNIFRKSKYKYSGKTENQVMSELDKLKRPSPLLFQRNRSLRNSLQQNALNRQSMGNIEKLSLGLNSNSSRTGTDSQLSTANNSPASKRNSSAALKQFETEHFPEDPESNRDSMLMDDDQLSELSLKTGNSSENSNLMDNLEELIPPPYSPPEDEEAPVESEESDEDEGFDEEEDIIVERSRDLPLQQDKWNANVITNISFVFFILALCVIPLAIIAKIVFIIM